MRSFRVFPIWMILLVSVTAIGCSGTSVNPAEPSNVFIPDVERTNESSRFLWGMWRVSFEPDSMSVEIEPIRESQGHYNVTGVILPPQCNDCFSIYVNSFDPVTRILDVDVSLYNPFNLNGHDVRGILFTDDAGHLLVNEDDWTGLFDIAGGMEVNPFKAFAKPAPNRLFASGSEHVGNYQIYVPIPPDWNGFSFAVDASWPGNCKEPYEIYDQGVTGEMYDVGYGEAEVSVKVRGWNNDIESVMLDLSAIGIAEPLDLSHIVDNEWGGDDIE